MKILVVSPDAGLVMAFRQCLPLGWNLNSAATGEEAMVGLDAFSPHLVVADLALSGMNGVALLQAVGRQCDPPPAMVLVTPPAADEATHAQAMALKVQELVHRPVDSEVVRRIYAPYRMVDGPPNMSLLEFLVTGYTDMSNRRLDLSASGHKISLVFGLGYLWAIVHPLFRDRYRSALSGAGFTLPPQDADEILDQANVEESLGNSPQLAALKQHTVLSILASMPLHLSFHGRISEVAIAEGLVPMDLPTVAVHLVEHVPQSALAVLRTPGLKVMRTQEVIPADLPMQTHQGYLLSVCETPILVKQLLQMGTVPENQVLTGLYLLLLLGLLGSEPGVGKPFRLAGLEHEMGQETQLISRQATAIESLVSNFQSPGRSPYDILGIPSYAGPRQAAEAYQLFQERLSPQKIHPEVYRRYQQDITLLKAKLSEAFLLLQSSFLLDKRLAKEEQAFSGGPAQETVGEAEDSHRKARQKKEAEKMLAMARALLVEEKPYDAGQCLKLAILYDPSLSGAHHLLGRAYAQARDTRSKHMAERKFLDALQFDPRNVDIHFDLAELYLTQGLMARCKACLDRAMKIDPRHPRVPELKEAIKLRGK